MTFDQFNFDPSLQEGIDAMGYKQATPVQEQVIPIVLEGRDLIASAQTGTGKTAAFLLPLLHRLLTEPRDHHSVNALIVVPTRELAVQIGQALDALSYFTDISSVAVFGGTDGESFVREKKALSSGADIVICTPGRMIAQLNMGTVALKGLQYLVLDEADRMLDMGFHGDILRILSHLPQQRQSLLFSATMPPKIRELAKKILQNPAEINIAISKPPDKIRQGAFLAFDEQKQGLISNLLTTNPYRLAVVFCSSKDAVKRLTYQLKKSHLKVAEIHSDLEQSEREQVLLDFRNEKIQTLVATDILSRGIDIDTIDLVINYDVPHDAEDYVHRIGRTARAERTGLALTLINPRDMRKFGGIERLLEKEVPKLPLPPNLGPGPEWNAGRQEGGGRGRPGGNRPGGGKPKNRFHGKKPAKPGGPRPPKPGA